MSDGSERLYAERLNRYVTALRNGKPDRVPVRPFAAEFVLKYAGVTNEAGVHDYNLVHEASLKCASEMSWDAAFPDAVFAHAGLSRALELDCAAAPGVEFDPVDGQVQYREPSEQNAYMKADEYDELIANPTVFLYNKWLPRVCKHIAAPGEPVTYRHDVALVEGAMAMLTFFQAIGAAAGRLRTEHGIPTAIAGKLKAPLDLIGDRLRGYVGLCMDLRDRPEKVLAACEALMPHLCHEALAGADPAKNVPITIFMHRGCVPFVRPRDFDEIYWPTLRPILDAIWAQGHQVMLYAEGKWAPHLDAFAELPAGSIVFHCDQDDIFEVDRALGRKFCISGGMPNLLLANGTPDEVRERCREVIDGVGADGGFIMDAGAIILRDAKVENVRAMTEFTQQYGVYSDPSPAPPPGPAVQDAGLRTRCGFDPGVCVPWDQKRQDLPSLLGHEDILRASWESVDGFGYMFIWQLLTW